MGRRPYRVEINYPKKGKPQYYLVKDVKVKGKRGKVKKYLGSGMAPTRDHVEKCRREYAYDLEYKAALKKADLSSSLYTSDFLNRTQMKTLEEIRFIYQTVRRFMTANEVKVYEENFEINYVHGTTFIEGNTLSLNEARDLLVNDVAPKEKTLREINEVQNFKSIVKFRNKYNGKVDLDFINHLHALIMNNIDMESAGSFRRTDEVSISGCNIKITPAIMVKEELENIMSNYYNRIENGKHPLEEAVLFHYNFEIIHPFNDGNGRVGREIFNYMLTKDKFPKLLFLGKDRERYISALQKGNAGEVGEMINLFSELVTEQRLQVLKDNLAKVVIPPVKDGQLRLPDFCAS